jgi:hypothetical protein
VNEDVVVMNYISRNLSKSLIVIALALSVLGLQHDLVAMGQNLNESESFLAKELEFRKIERWVRWRALGLDKWTIDNIREPVIKKLEEDVKKEKRRIHTLIRFRVLSSEQGEFLYKHIENMLESAPPRLWLLLHKQMVRDNRKEMMRLNKLAEKTLIEERDLRREGNKLKPKERADLYAEAHQLSLKIKAMKERHEELKEENKKIKKLYGQSFADYYRAYKDKDKD